MKLYEFEGKALFRGMDIPTLRGTFEEITKGFPMIKMIAKH